MTIAIVGFGARGRRNGQRLFDSGNAIVVCTETPGRTAERDTRRRRGT
jgi:ketol-acid reductoisomerase